MVCTVNFKSIFSEFSYIHTGEEEREDAENPVRSMISGMRRAYALWESHSLPNPAVDMASATNLVKSTFSTPFTSRIPFKPATDVVTLAVR